MTENRQLLSDEKEPLITSLYKTDTDINMPFYFYKISQNDKKLKLQEVLL